MNVPKLLEERLVFAREIEINKERASLVCGIMETISKSLNEAPLIFVKSHKERGSLIYSIIETIALTSWYDTRWFNPIMSSNQNQLRCIIIIWLDLIHRTLDMSYDIDFYPFTLDSLLSDLYEIDIDLLHKINCILMNGATHTLYTEMCKLHGASQETRQVWINENAKYGG